MSEEGFVKLYRKMMSWSWYKDSKVKSLFIHCLLKANHQDRQWHNILVKRGSFLTSLSHLAEETGLTTKEVRRALEQLIEAKCLAKTSTAKNTMVTVLRYDEYQTEGKARGKVSKSENPHEHRTFKASGRAKGQSKGQSEGKVRARTVSSKGKVKGKVPESENPHEHRTFPDDYPTGGQSNGQDTGQSEGKVRATNKNEKKYLSPIRETDTAHTPACPEGSGRLAPEQQQQTEQKSGGIIPLKELLTYAETVPDSQSKLVLEFHGGFEQSGTVMPPEWQDLYRRYVVADAEHRRQFIELLESGALRERWGDVHDTA